MPYGVLVNTSEVTLTREMVSATLHTTMKNTSPKKAVSKPKKVLPKKVEQVIEMAPPAEPYVPSRFTPTPLMIGIAFIILVGVGVFGFLKRERDMMVRLQKTVIPAAVKTVLGNTGTEIKDVRNLKKTSGVVSFELDLSTAGQTQTYTSYITTDGKILFTAGIIVGVLGEKTAAATPTPKAAQTCSDVKTSDTPHVTAFVVSQCPYGLQMQRAYAAAIGEQKDLANYLDVKYIGSVVDGKITSMHGEEEAVENHRQICVREEQKEKYWAYVSCYMKKGESESCMASTGVNVGQVSACMADANRGVAYAQKDFDIAKQFNIGSSPTLLVNNETIVSESGFGGRVPDALKSIVCCAAANKPAFCSQELSKTAIAASFSETVTGTGTGAAANCGN